MPRAVPLVAIAAAIACLAQTSSTPLAKSFAVDPPLNLYLDSSGSPHLGITLPAAVTGPTGGTGATGSTGTTGGTGATGAAGLPLTVQITPGLALVSTTPGVSTIMLDTALFAYRAAAPTAPGPCAVGTGEWAADSGFFYFCVPSATNSSAFVWARVPLSTTW